MNDKTSILNATLMACTLLLTAGAAHADSACWKPDEARAYDLTMQTLMMAHVASDCDQTVTTNPTLKQDLASFLSHNGAQLDSDRAALNRYFQRAYAEDWENPLKASLNREESRVDQMVKQAATPDFCNGAADEFKTMSQQSWADYIKDTEGRQWHQKAGLPVCGQ